MQKSAYNMDTVLVYWSLMVFLNIGPMDALINQVMFTRSWTDKYPDGHSWPILTIFWILYCATWWNRFGVYSTLSCFKKTMIIGWPFRHEWYLNWLTAILNPDCHLLVDLSCTTWWSWWPWTGIYQYWITMGGADWILSCSGFPWAELIGFIMDLTWMDLTWSRYPQAELTGSDLY